MFTRRFVLGALFAAPVSATLARTRLHALDPHPHGFRVDVSPLRARGDNTDADFLADVLPGYLRAAFGPGRDVSVRIDDVTFGSAGSNGQLNGNGAVDSIQGVGWVDGREVPLFASVQTTVYFPDIGGYAARTRQDQLARSFAQWLPGQAGAWR